MRYQKVVLFLVAASLVPADREAESSETTPGLEYRLVAAKRVGVKTGIITCQLRVDNASEATQFFFRPGGQGLSLEVKGVSKKSYFVSWQEQKTEFESLWKERIALRPKCSFEMPLAQIRFAKVDGSGEPLRKRNYVITGLWKRSDFGVVKGCSFEVIEEYVPETVTLEPGTDEYPFGIVLESSLKEYRQGEPVLLSIRMQNNGEKALKLLNFFHPYEDYFLLDKYDDADKLIETELHPLKLVTPTAGGDWITLLPAESLSAHVDASNAFPATGRYRAKTTYPRKALMIGIDGKAAYTGQHKWISNRVVFDISDRPAEKPVADNGRPHVWLLLALGLAALVTGAGVLVLRRKPKLNTDK